MIKHSGALLLLLVIGVVLLANSMLTQGMIAVCYDISTSEGAITKVYWGANTDFNEARSVSKEIKAGPVRTVCLHFPWLRNFKHVRVDPVDREAEFTIRNVYLKRLDLLFPWRQMQHVNLEFQNLLDKRDVVISQSAAGDVYRSASNDPYLVWGLDVDYVRISKSVALNYITITMLLIIGIAALSLFTKAGLSAQLSEYKRGAFIFSFYFAFCLIAWLAGYYVDLFRFSDIIIYFCVLLLFIYCYGRLSDLLTRRAAFYLPIMSIVMLTVIFDVAFRLGAVNKQLFSKHPHEFYHWDITRRAEDNLINSSVRYYRDFHELRQLLKPGSWFLADLPTSYYVTAALNIYPVVAHRHHKDWVHLYQHTINIICKKVGAKRFLSHLNSKEKQLRFFEKKLPSYLIIIHDEINRHIRSGCLTREFEDINKTLKAVLPLVYEGEYVTVFELTSTGVRQLENHQERGFGT